MTDSLLRSLEAALKAMPLLPEDAAAIALARNYAHAIDENYDMLPVLGRGYRETLVELGMTPKTRAALVKGQQAPPPASPMDELRARREKRKAR